jgi:hypothetical protein
MSVCTFPLSLLGSDPVAGQRLCRIFVCVPFYAVGVVSKETRRLVLLRTSCYLSAYSTAKTPIIKQAEERGKETHKHKQR